MEESEDSIVNQGSKEDDPTDSFSNDYIVGRICTFDCSSKKFPPPVNGEIS